MNEQQATVYEQMVAFYDGAGLSPSVAKVLSWLTVCEPAIQDAQSIREGTKISTGRLSEALTVLSKTNLVTKIKKPGDKKLYYELQNDNLAASFEQRITACAALATIASQGAKTLPSNSRVEELRDLYAFLSKRLPEVMEEYYQKYL